MTFGKTVFSWTITIARFVLEESIQVNLTNSVYERTRRVEEKTSRKWIRAYARIILITREFAFPDFPSGRNYAILFVESTACLMSVKARYNETILRWQTWFRTRLQRGGGRASLEIFKKTETQKQSNNKYILCSSRGSWMY